MKLYYSPGACSLAPHIALTESKLDFETEKVDLKTKKTETGDDFLKINPNGYVPVLKINISEYQTEYLTECGVILQYIADQSALIKLAPSANSFESYRFKEWLNFISTEIHKAIGVMFKKGINDEFKQVVLETLNKRFNYLNVSLTDKEYLMGKQFTVADAYLFTVMRWTKAFSIDLSPWPALTQYLERIKQRPLVQETLKNEGLT